MKILNIVGARPNFVKIAPLHRAFQQYDHIDSKIVHTGQHYDKQMSDIFFNQLEMPVPDYYLGVGSGSHAETTARIMVEFEAIAKKENPDLVLVVGDVNSTLACAIVAKKLNIKLVHVEAGLRSGDRKMPEEINRILTDSISDYLFVTEESGMTNLANEGVSKEKTFFVGNVMIDSLCHYQKKAEELSLLKRLKLRPKQYALMTMHRPSNVDEAHKLGVILEVISSVCENQQLVFPLHPRTLKNFKKFNLFNQLKAIPNLKILKPQGYLEFLLLMTNSSVIITDSGGIQEESTYLKVPCLTIRDTTERPITITLGTNTLIPELESNLIIKAYENTFNSKNNASTIPPLWDGKAADRIAAIIDQEFKYLSIENELSDQPQYA